MVWRFSGRRLVLLVLAAALWTLLLAYRSTLHELVSEQLPILRDVIRADSVNTAELSPVPMKVPETSQHESITSKSHLVTSGIDPSNINWTRSYTTPLTWPNYTTSTRSMTAPSTVKTSLNHQIHTGQFTIEKRTSPVDKKIAQRLQDITETIKVAGTNCSALFQGVERKLAAMPTKKKRADGYIVDKSYLTLTSNCSTFQQTRGYIMSSLTPEEENFPLAYSLMVFKDAEQVERLLRAVYRPQNYYCIHVDQKASEDFYNATVAISACFDNVFVLSTRVTVWWGYFGVLEPELLCMRELWKFPRWKYFINLTGQEFPLKNNWELVQIFTAYRGASDVQTFFKCADKIRWNKTWPPHKLRPAKGAVHITVNRHFVDYILHNQTAIDLLEWTKHTRVPDETYFPILNSNPQLRIPGTYTGTLDSCNDERLFLARYKMWMKDPCARKRRRQICILSVGDLPRLVAAKHLFANKFYLYQDRTVIGCLEEKIFNTTRDQYLALASFDTTFYAQQDFVLKQVV